MGEPGAGKSTVLLDHAQQLLKAARTDAAVPLVLNLQSWRNQRNTMLEWLTQRLALEYDVPQELGEHWLLNKQVLPFLDGFDEIRPELRDRCVQRINEFVKNIKDAGLVVCSRTVEYRDETQGRLLLQEAVELVALEDADVVVFLRGAGQQLEGVLTLHEEDPELRVLLRNPLFLQLAVLAYQGRTGFDLSSSDSTRSHRQHIFEQYVHRALTDGNASLGRSVWRTRIVGSEDLLA